MTTAASVSASLGPVDGKLYGRDQEQETLHRAYRSVCHKSAGLASLSEQEELTDKNVLVLISGKAGSGKTALANTLRREVVQKDEGFFISGKFEQIWNSEPYDVFISALTEYMDQLLGTGAQSFIDNVRKRVLEAVGEEANLLTDVVPQLKQLIGEPKEPASRVYGSEASNRFRYVFCKSIRALSKCAPLVMFLDDLQWADTTSMELLWALLNTSNSSLLLIGAHRCRETWNEAPQSRVSVCSTFSAAFTELVRDVEEEGTQVRVTKLMLHDLSVEDVRVMLPDLLGKSVEESSVLGDLVHAHSRGNTFHILQFLKLLTDQRILTRNSESNVWEWVDDDVCVCLSAEGTIMDLIRRRIEKLPRMLQGVLHVASCMGDEIDDSALEIALQSDVGSLLGHAVDEGLLFSPQSGGHRWSHDLVRQTAFEMIPESERAAFNLKIGRRLWIASSEMDLDKNVFVVISLLSKGVDLMKDERERFTLAELNLRAGKQAVRLSAVSDAARFLENGISLLGPNHWEDEYELTLELFSTAAEVEAIIGNSERAVVLVEEVLGHAHCLHDKVSVYCSLMRSAEQQDVATVMRVGLDVLQQFDQPLQVKASKFTIFWEFLRVRRSLRHKSNEDLLKLPRMVDESMLSCMRILDLMFMYSYQARSPYTPLVALRLVRLTMKYGINSASTMAFAVYGMLLCSMGDVQTGYRFGQLAISLADLLRCKEVLPKVYLFTGGTIRHWTEPVRDSLLEVRKGVKIGLDTGDVLASLKCRAYLTWCSMHLGTNLATVEEWLTEGIKQARAYRCFELATMYSGSLQAIHCLTGRTENPSQLSGTVLDFHDAMTFCQEANNVLAMFSIRMHALTLAYMFGDFEFAATMAAKVRELEEKSPSASYSTTQFRFMDGLVAIALARDGTDRRKNINIAKCSLRMMTRWAKLSPRNYLAKQKLLEAELLSLKTNRDASFVYDEALQLFEKEGYTSDAALTCERLAEYKSMIGEENAAAEIWSHAVNLHEQMGAMAKSKHLRKTGLVRVASFSDSGTLTRPCQ